VWLLQGYRIYQGGLTPATSVWRPATLDARRTQTTVTDLSPDNMYQFQMSAFTAVGDGPLSDTVHVALRSAGLRRLIAAGSETVALYQVQHH